MSDPKVICVKGDNSNWYEQAIFILNKNTAQKKVPVDLVAEAERIVSGYYNNPTAYRTVAVPSASAIKRKPGKTFDIAMNIIMLVCCVALTGVLMWNFM